MNTLIHAKRDSLETFIREQMIGPNGCRGHFDLEENDFDNNVDEIINTTPGTIYSTAILFPKEKKSNSTQNLDRENPEAETGLAKDRTATGNESITDDPDEDDVETLTDLYEKRGENEDDVNDDAYSANRRFPNMIGISCCLAPSVDWNRSIKISVSGRYYTQIKGKQREKVQVVIDTAHKEKFDEFYRENREKLAPYFVYDGINNRLKLHVIDYEIEDKVKDLLKNINKQYAKNIAMLPNGTEDPCYTAIPINYRNLLTYKEALFKKLDSRNEQAQLSDQVRQDIKDRIECIEMYEAILSYFEDLVALYNYKDYGFWRSHTFTAPLDLSSIDFSQNTNSAKVIYKPSDYSCLDQFFSETIEESGKEEKQDSIALSAWLQVTKNTQNPNDKNNYLKVMLVNDSDPYEPKENSCFSIVNTEVNKRCFFGIKIEIACEDIVAYQTKHDYSDAEAEEDQLNFLYRNVKDYGVGHLCSVDWPRTGKVNRIWSEFMPAYETPDVETIPRQKDAEYIEENGMLVPKPYMDNTDYLQFKRLSVFSDATNEEIINGLRDFVGYYKNWIDTAKSKAEKFDDTDRVFATKNLEKCEADMRRMQSNIDQILAAEDENMNCFRLMNAAMFIQLWHSVENNKTTIRENGIEPNADFYRNANDEIFRTGQHAAWRPFQLAFILLNLDGIIQNPEDQGWKKRNELVDLVWFPTGGGKTEAYLGLIALTIIYRRRKYGEQGAGMTAIMRYTLRLLTTQQFQRALRLIIALEQMRRWECYNLGNTEISIGLYVGKNSIPNSQADLDSEAANWNNGGKSKIPLKYCPVCGSKLSYETHSFSCRNEQDACTFRDRLPVRLCDEHIYKEPPTLLIGTVDKFADLAHTVSSDNNKKDSRRLFGKGTDCLPPDLIIQDELHLLLGPLGSAVSLFECAIDQLCGRTDGTRPKIISSTATTRNTGLQIRALYDRDVNIFPHSGVDYDDSFFAFYKRKKEDGKVSFVSKRKYIGIMPTGRTQMPAQMRLAAIALVHRAIFEAEYATHKDFEFVADNYYSVISYFNSLRELGKTDAQFYAEYSKHVRRLFRKVLRNGGMLEYFYSMRELKETELSSRISGNEANEKFAEVAQKWTKNDRLPHIINGNWVSGTTPPDFILATNMISVGLDVSRFNTIIMNSMPRNIAEYIQASSRVARAEEGLVLTLHNPFRSRDVSHYEKFIEFHEKMYFYVEPISITPFSQKSIERYFALYLATIVRHTIDKLANRDDANRLTPNYRNTILDKIRSYFDDRFNRTSKLASPIEKSLLTQEQKNYVSEYAEKLLDEWNQELSQRNGKFVYYAAGPNQNNESALFIDTDDYEDNSSGWVVPKSLRIVEPEAVLHIN